jgi:hypothetical protein
LSFSNLAARDQVKRLEKQAMRELKREEKAERKARKAGLLPAADQEPKESTVEGAKAAPKKVVCQLSFERLCQGNVGLSDRLYW